MSGDKIDNIMVVGAGTMGHQIAMLSALAGYQTTLVDINREVLTNAKNKLNEIMDRWIKKGRISEEKRDEAFNRLKMTSEMEVAARNSDFVIEAVIEDIDIKRNVFRELDELLPEHTIIATNSSTIVSSKLAEVTNRKDKICNMHFFYPPLVMDCIEIVKGEHTSDETIEKTLNIAKDMNRTAVVLQKEIPGFIANRILHAIQKEAISLYEEGYADFKDIDLICKKALNHPMGPFELMDFSGIDVVNFFMKQTYSETGDPSDAPPRIIQEKVKEGSYGRKSGKGFYVYN